MSLLVPRHLTDRPLLTTLCWVFVIRPVHLTGPPWGGLDKVSTIANWGANPVLPPSRRSLELLLCVGGGGAQEGQDFIPAHFP